MKFNENKKENNAQNIIKLLKTSEKEKIVNAARPPPPKKIKNEKQKNKKFHRLLVRNYVRKKAME